MISYLVHDEAHIKSGAVYKYNNMLNTSPDFISTAKLAHHKNFKIYDTYYVS